MEDPHWLQALLTADESASACPETRTLFSLIYPFDLFCLPRYEQYIILTKYSYNEYDTVVWCFVGSCFVFTRIDVVLDWKCGLLRLRSSGSDIVPRRTTRLKQTIVQCRWVSVLSARVSRLVTSHAAVDAALLCWELILRGRCSIAHCGHFAPLLPQTASAAGDRRCATCVEELLARRFQLRSTPFTSIDRLGVAQIALIASVVSAGHAGRLTEPIWRPAKSSCDITGSDPTWSVIHCEYWVNILWKLSVRLWVPCDMALDVLHKTF